MLKRFARFIPVLAAAVAVAVALAVLSRVMVTVDAIAQPEYRYAYLGGVALLLGGLGVFAWAKLRPRREAQAPRQIPHHRRLSPEARLGEIYERHHLDRSGPSGAGPERASARPREPGHLRVALAGVRGVGKSALAAALRAAAASDGFDALSVDLVELPALGTNLGHNLESLTPALSADLTLFLVDQDLRDYEQDAIAALAHRQAKFLVVINKSDLMRPAALAETRAAIAARLASGGIEADILTTAAAPRPTVRLAEEGDGEDEDAARPPEVAAIINYFETLAVRRGCSAVRVLPGAG